MAIAAEGNYEAMVLGCIDPRLQEPVRQVHGEARTDRQVQPVRHRRRRDRRGRAEPFKDWHKAFWDNLATSIELHNIKKVIAIDHRDCGAAKIAYGEAAVADQGAETETHRKALAEFRKQVGEAPAEARGRDRPDGDQRQDREAWLIERAFRSLAPGPHELPSAASTLFTAPAVRPDTM